MGPLWSTIIGSGLSIGGVVLYIYLFLNANKVSKIPVNHKLLRRIEHSVPIAGSLIGFFFVWYNDMYRMPTVYYGILYIYYLMVYFLLDRAAHRAPVE